MSIQTFKPMIFAAAILTAISAMLPAVTLAQSIDYRFESGSTYTLNDELMRPPFYNLSGTFTLNETSTSTTITNAVLELSDGTSNQVDSPITDQVTDILESDLFALLTSNGSETVYQATQFASDPFIANNFLITIDNGSANRLVTFSGGYATDPAFIVDGGSFSFSATAAAVPEPTSLPACLLLAITLIAMRSRSTSRSFIASRHCQ